MVSKVSTGSGIVSDTQQTYSLAGRTQPCLVMLCSLPLVSVGHNSRVWRAFKRAVLVGEHHKKQRKLLNPVFSINHMRYMTPIFYETVHRVRYKLTSRLINPTGL